MSHGITQSLNVAREKTGPSPWLRQIRPGQGILIYRDLPPAVMQTPGYFNDRRFSGRWKRPRNAPPEQNRR
jgi:hypothetical protein